MHNLKYPLILVCLLTFTACGGGGGSGNKTSAPSSSAVSSSSSSVESSSSSEESSSSTSSSSASVDNLSLKSLVDFPVGVAVSAGNEANSLLLDNTNGTAQRVIAEQHFDQLTAGNIMKMSYLHPGIDTFNFTQADALLEYANNHDMTIHAHTLIWHSDYQVPNWMKNFAGDKAAWSAMLQTHVQTIAAHFSGRVPSWDVVNEAFEDNGSYRNSLFYQKMNKDYIEEAFANARAADATADLYYNDYNLSQGGAKLNAVLAMADDFQTRNIPISGIGFQMHVNIDWPRISDIKASFAAVVARGLKVKITELDIPINNPYDGSYNFPNNYVSELTPTHAQRQKVRYCEIAKAYIDTVPANLRGGFSVWGIWDGDTWLNAALFNNNHVDWPLLFDINFQPKPALTGVANALAGQPCS